MERLRIAHISDLHFGKITLSPLQFFSKRWLGNLNLIFSRKRTLAPEKLSTLFRTFEDLKIDVVIVTGDLSTTSLGKEFAKAKEFLDQLEKLGIRVISIPGNHDHYTRGAWKKKRFYDYFPALGSKEIDLKKDGIAALELNRSWSLVALDTALATPLTSSRGLFSEQLEEKLSNLLHTIPKSTNVILINHFPLFHHERASKVLERATALREVLHQFPNVRFYLHGHTHRHCIADLRTARLPIILDSGSTADQKHGSWNLLDLSPLDATAQAFRNGSEGTMCWQPFRKLTWSFR